MFPVFLFGIYSSILLTFPAICAINIAKCCAINIIAKFANRHVGARRDQGVVDQVARGEVLLPVEEHVALPVRGPRVSKMSKISKNYNW